MTSTFRARFAEGEDLPTYVVLAFNDAAQSENKIHDDSIARQYGFRGGLVPGVTVHAYMTHPVAEVLGLPWVEHGRMSARFLKPVYEGEETTISATVTGVSDSGVVFEVSVQDPSGELCATGSASLELPVTVAPAAEAFPATAASSGERPAADERSLATGTVLGTLREVFRPEDHEVYLNQIGEKLELYRGPGAVAHPGWLLRRANSVLVQQVRLGPWIHVSSGVTNFGLLQAGDSLETRAVVTDLFERKGHRFVDLDVLLVANGNQPVMRVAHRAIYEVRRADS